ncbi:MAG: VCBS repeat-containing protein [Myxococcota bacterium]
MIRRILSLGALLVALVMGGNAQAYHMVWLDFSEFDLSDFAMVNGNTPPTAADVAAVRKQILTNMVEDYAPFDVQFSTFEPDFGRNSRVRFRTGVLSSSFGCAGPGCCATGGSCTGIGSWDDLHQSSSEVYVETFANNSNWQGANATTARIANAISHTASHELGHVMDLLHCNAADDSITLGCSGITTNTNDANPNWHIMASGRSWGLATSARATRDRFMSIHASRRILHGNVQVRNHWNSLADLNGGGRSDLAYGRFDTSSKTRWFGRLSTGSAFGGWTEWRGDAGDAGDIFLTGDVTGDGKGDLVYGRFISSSQVRWLVRESLGDGFSGWVRWRNDAGNVGDIFRLADVDGDGRDDLIYGRPVSSSQIRWFVRRSSGSAFGPWENWRDDAGDEGDIFMVGDVDADGRDDLVYGRQPSSWQTIWYARRSTGSGFGTWWTWRVDAGDRGDLFYLGDGDGDGDADLIYGRTLSDNEVRWYFRPAKPSILGFWFGKFGAYETWRNDAGDAGDLFRIGDGSGDGRTDLLYGRPRGMTSLTATPDLSRVRWYGRTSTGSGFSSWSTWRSDAGDEGDIFP